MPNLTQATITMAEQFKEMLDAIMEAPNEEARQEAYEAFAQHKIVEKQLRIAEKMEPTKHGISKKQICPDCSCATTNLKQHQKTMKCHETWETMRVTHRVKTTMVADCDIIMYRAVQDAKERREDYVVSLGHHQWVERVEKVKEFYKENNAIEDMVCLADYENEYEKEYRLKYGVGVYEEGVRKIVDAPVVDAPVVDAPVVEMPTPVAETTKPPKKKLKLKLAALLLRLP